MPVGFSLSCHSSTVAEAMPLSFFRLFRCVVFIINQIVTSPTYILFFECQFDFALPFSRSGCRCRLFPAADSFTTRKRCVIIFSCVRWFCRRKCLFFQSGFGCGLAAGPLSRINRCLSPHLCVPYQKDSYVFYSRLFFSFSFFFIWAYKATWFWYKPAQPHSYLVFKKTQNYVPQNYLILA